MHALAWMLVSALGAEGRCQQGRASCHAHSTSRKQACRPFSMRCAAQATHPPCRRADKAPGQLQLRRKPASRPSLNSLQGAFEALDVAGDGGRGGIS